MSSTDASTSDLGALQAGPIACTFGRVSLALLWAVSIAAGVHLWSTFSEYIFEDAFITYRYADNLAQGHGFAFNVGERVLGTTAPLYTLILACLGRLGADVSAASGAIFAASIAAVCVLGGLTLRDRGAPMLGLAFAIFAGVGGPELYRFFGLETPVLVALLLGAARAGTRGRDYLGAVLVALAFLTRYDAALFAILFFGLLWIRDRRLPVGPGLLATVLVIPWLGFAQAYFGSVLPNTLGAKTGDTGLTQYLSGAARRQWELSTSWFRAEGPWTFLGEALPTVMLAVLGAGVLSGLVFTIRSRRPVYLVLLLHPALLLLGYGLIGPNLNFLWYLAPGTICLVLFSLLGLADLLGLLRVRPVVELALVPLLALGLPGLHSHMRARHDALTHGTQYRFRVEAYRAMSEFVVDAGLASKTLLTLEPGYFAYLSHNPVIDQAGLVTKGIYFHGDPSRRTSADELVERRRPGLIVSGSGRPKAGYVPVFTAGTRYTLLLRDDVYAAHFGNIQDASRRAARSAAAEIREPFEYSFSAPGRQRWIMDGGISAPTGRPFHLSLLGEPYDKDYMFVPFGSYGAETPTFRIDFDRIEFLLAAKSDRFTRAQLIVGGQPVLSVFGRTTREDQALDEVVLDLAPWRGSVATLRFINWSGRSSAIAFNEIRSGHDVRRRVLDDFEAGARQEVWESSFRHEPARISVAAARHSVLLPSMGHGALSMGLEGAQRQTSHPFCIDQDELRFTLLDFGDARTAVSLLVNGEVVFSEPGTGAQEARAVRWDLTGIRGEDAILQVADDAVEGEVWIGVDNLVLATPDATPPRTSITR